MKQILLFAIIFFLFQVPSSAQRSIVEPKQGERINVNKPTVYLEYVCQDEKKIYLRMHNNTMWHISISAEKSYFLTNKPIILGNGNKWYAIPNDEEVPIHYYIEKDELENIKKIKTPEKEPYYQNGGGRIVSQDSILFSVPIEHLRKGLKIYVEFNYEWELTESGFRRNEPKHRVYFRGGDIGSANTEIEPTVCRK
jgi:hypothetical protein